MTSYGICLSDLFHLVWEPLAASMFLQMGFFFSFLQQVVFHCVYVPHLNPFICQWTFRLYPWWLLWTVLLWTNIQVYCSHFEVSKLRHGGYSDLAKVTQTVAEPVGWLQGAMWASPWSAALAKLDRSKKVVGLSDVVGGPTDRPKKGSEFAGFPLPRFSLYAYYVSSSIHVAENGIIFFFSWLSSILLYICTTSFFFFFRDTPVAYGG